MGVPCVFAESCASACSGKGQLTVSGRESEAWMMAGSLQVLQPTNREERGKCHTHTHHIQFIFALHLTAYLKNTLGCWPTYIQLIMCKIFSMNHFKVSPIICQKCTIIRLACIFSSIKVAAAQFNLSIHLKTLQLQL